MAIDGYMAFQFYKKDGGGFLQSESQVTWNDKSNLGGKDKEGFITLGDAASAKGLFEIEEWGFGIERVLSTASQSGGIGTGSATFNAFTVTRKIDKASPQFFEMSCSGTTFQKVVLALRKGAGGAESGQVYLRYDFKLVGVKAVNWSHAEDAPTETIEFEYGAVAIRYSPQNPDGTLLTPIPGGWNRIGNVQDRTSNDIQNK